MHERILPGALENVTFKDMDVTIDGKVVGKVIEGFSDRRGLRLSLEITDSKAYNALLYGTKPS